jgi:hypothetical protein
MTTEEKVQRRKELATLETELKNKKDFGKLVQLQDETMALGGAVGDYIDRLPQKVYCLARLGKKDEAIQVLNEFSRYQMILDPDEYECIVRLLLVFITTPVSAFNETHTDHLMSFLDGHFADLTQKIVFDYKTIAGLKDISPFQSSDEKYAMLRLSEDQLEFMGQMILIYIIPDFRNDDDMLYNPNEDETFFIKISYAEKVYEGLEYYMRMIYKIDTSSYKTDRYDKGIVFFFKIKQAVQDLENMYPIRDDYRRQLRPFRFPFTE